MNDSNSPLKARDTVDSSFNKLEHNIQALDEKVQILVKRIEFQLYNPYPAMAEGKSSIKEAEKKADIIERIDRNSYSISRITDVIDDILSRIAVD